MFIEGKRYGSKGLSTKFYASDLDDKGENEDQEEHRVVEEICKYIDLGFFELSGIDLIEDLHQDEAVEENAVMFSTFIVPVTD